MNTTGTEFQDRAQLVVAAQAHWPHPARKELKLPEGGWEALIEESAREVFELMLGSSVSPSPDTPEPQAASLTAMVGLGGDLCGVFSIRCETAVAGRMASRMLGMDLPSFNEETMDAVGEICNMVAGGLKAKVPGLEDRCMLSVPTVIHGHDYRTRSLGQGERTQVALNFEGAVFWIVLDLHG